jgi:hypothetical protein
MSQLPPVVAILLEEQPPESTDPCVEMDYLKKLLPELRRQSTWSRENYHYPGAAELLGRFGACPADSVDPFGVGCCHQWECRRDRALMFARTVALHADVCFPIDALTSRFVGLPKRVQTSALLDIVTNIRVLHLLKPLIEAGGLSFRSPFFHFCQVHFEEFESKAERLSRALRSSIGDSVECERVGDHLFIRGYQLFEPPLTSVRLLTVREREGLTDSSQLRKLAKTWVERRLQREVRNLLLSLQSCQSLGAALISSSRYEMLALDDLEGGSARFHSPEKWEAPRSLQLPWINALTVPEVVRLREEAGAALAGLREKLSRALLFGEGESLGGVVAELREEATMVEAELKALQRKRAREFRGVVGVLGVGFSVYGFAAGLVPPAQSVAILTSLLALIHSSSHKEEQESIRLTSRPGYALLRARELVKHRQTRV